MMTDPDILSLGSLRPVSTVKETQFDLIRAEHSDPVAYCTKCGCFAALQRHGSKEITLMDLPIHGRRVGILIERQRYESLWSYGEPLSTLRDQRHYNLLDRQTTLFYEEPQIGLLFPT